MRKHLTAVLIGSGAAALALGIGTAAMATTATTFTVKPGGAVTGTAGKTVLKDTKTGTVLTCVSSATKATLKKGSGVSGTALGKITSVTFSTCTGPGGLKFTATTSASTSNPWNLNAASFSNGVTKGTITKVTASLSGNGCTATVAGTSATTTGKTNGSYSNSTHVLTASGGNLHVWNVSAGCLGLINTGDGTTFTGKYKISPAQTITSP
jgi:hypothetical protein